MARDTEWTSYSQQKDKQYIWNYSCSSCSIISSLQEKFLNCIQRVNWITMWMSETLGYNTFPRITSLLNRFPSLSKYIIDQFSHWFRTTGSSLFFEFQVCQNVLDNSDEHHFYLQRLLRSRQLTELAPVIQGQPLSFFTANLAHVTEVLLVSN